MGLGGLLKALEVPSTQGSPTRISSSSVFKILSLFWHFLLEKRHMLADSPCSCGHFEMCLTYVGRFNELFEKKNLFFSPFPRWYKYGQQFHCPGLPCWHHQLIYKVGICISQSHISLKKMSYRQTDGPQVHLGPITISKPWCAHVGFVFVLWPLSFRLLLYLGTRGGWVSSAPGCLWWSSLPTNTRDATLHQHQT